MRPSPRPSSTRPRSSRPGWAARSRSSSGRPPQRRRRRPRRLDAGPHRARPGHPRVPAGRGIPGRRLPRRPVRLGPRFAGGPAGAPVTSSPTPTSTPPPPRASASSRSATPTCRRMPSPSPTPWSPRPAGAGSPCSSRRPARRAARAPGLPRGSHRLHRHLPRPRAGARSLGLAPRRRTARPHLLTPRHHRATVYPPMASSKLRSRGGSARWGKQCRPSSSSILHVGPAAAASRRSPVSKVASSASARATYAAS